MAACAATAKFSKIVLASPSEFPYSTSSHGGVAQLGERLTGSQEVRGSIPLVSTTRKIRVPTFSSEPFLCYLGLVLGLIVKIGSFFFTGRVFFRLGFGGGHDPR